MLNSALSTARREPFGFTWTRCHERKKAPALQHHKATGQAKVRIAGKDHYLGEFGSAAARDRYNELIEEWFAKQGDSTVAISVDDLALLYMSHADAYYVKNGKPTAEIGCIRQSLRFVLELFGTIRARDFSPKKLKAVRDAMVKAGLKRGTINKNVSRIRRVFRWATSEELIPSSVFEGLRAVDGLRYGRSAAKESVPVKPVELDLVAATLPFLAPVVADMVRLQLLTGARSGEICSLRPCDIAFGTDGTWTFTPASHKTEHHGKVRKIHIGPEGQQVLRPYLTGRDADAYCFSPQEAEAQALERRMARSKSPRRPEQKRVPVKNPKRAAGTFYESKVYGRAIKRGCLCRSPVELRKIDDALPSDERQRLKAARTGWLTANHWHPHRLRHTAATTIRREAGLEVARTVLGQCR